MEYVSQLKITKHGKLAEGKQSMGGPKLCYKVVWKWDTKSVSLNAGTLETLVSNRKTC